MKTNFKFLNQLVIIVALIGLLSPNLVYAQGGNLSPGGNNKNQGGFCTKINNSKFDQQIATKISNLQRSHRKNTTAITQKRANHDAKLATNRAAADTKRGNELDALKADATTPAQKTAVAKFVATVKTAIAKRRTAIDSAIRTYQAGVDKALATRKSALTTVLTNYYNTMNAALTVAKADCAKDGDSTAARAKFTAVAEAAKTKLQTERTAIEKLKTSLTDLIAARKAAIAKAVDDFRTTFETAKAELAKVEETEG